MSFKFIRWCTCAPSIDPGTPEEERQALLNKPREKHRLRIYKLRKTKKYKILLLNHTDEEVEREMVIAAMGGEACGCVKAARSYKEFEKGAEVGGRKYPGDAE